MKFYLYRWLADIGYILAHIPEVITFGFWRPELSVTVATWFYECAEEDMFKEES